MAKIALRRREPVAEGTFAFYFDKPPDFSHEAGQNAMFTLINPPEERGLHLAALPTSVQPPIPNQLSEPERSWRTQLRHHQTEYATQLYLLSRRVKANTLSVLMLLLICHR